MRKVDKEFAHRIKITSFDEGGFTYYSLYTGGYWDIIGFRPLSEGRVTLRLMHFEDDFLDDTAFVAEQHADPYFSFNVPGCEQFLRFIEQEILRKEAVLCGRTQHFEKLDTLQLQEIHYFGNDVGRWYRYVEKIPSKEKEKMSLISLPYWNKKYGIHQISGLWLITLNTSQLDSNHFDLIKDTHGLGTITVTKEALEELVYMIRETLKDIE